MSSGTIGKKGNVVGLGVGLVPLLAMMAPFGIWVWQLSMAMVILLDEAFKAWMVRVVAGRMERRAGLYLLVLCGLIFAGSKLILSLLGGPVVGVLGWRLALVVPMQVVTIVLMWWGWRNNLEWLGFAGAVVVHAGFVSLVWSY